MTIDEAKIKIGELACYARTKGWDDEYTEAVNMIIKALEQQPTDAVDRVTIKEYLYNLGMGIKVTATDAVDRQAVLKAIDAKAWEFCDYLIREGRNDEQKPVSHFADNLRECVGEDLPSVSPQPKMGRCKDCKYFEYDSVAKVDGIPLIVAHEICKRWGDGCKSREDGYCFLFETRAEGSEE